MLLHNGIELQKSLIPFESYSESKCFKNKNKVNAHTQNSNPSF